MKLQYNTFDLTGAPFFVDKISGIDGVRCSYITTKSLGQDGSAAIRGAMEEREIGITGTIRQESKELLEHAKLQLIDLFHPKEEGTLLYEDGGIKRKIKARVEKGPVFSPVDVWRVKKYTVSLIAYNPYWQDTEEKKTDIALWKGSFCFPLAIPKETGMRMGYKEPALIVNVENTGGIETGMRIVFRARGSLKNPSLYDVNKRKQIKIYKDMAPGEEITVNTNFGEKGAVSRLNGIETNILHFLRIYEEDFSFLQLAPGSNLFRYDAETGAENLEISIYHNNLYLGV